MQWVRVFGSGRGIVALLASLTIVVQILSNIESNTHDNSSELDSLIGIVNMSIMLDESFHTQLNLVLGNLSASEIQAVQDFQADLHHLELVEIDALTGLLGVNPKLDEIIHYQIECCANDPQSYTTTTSSSTEEVFRGCKKNVYCDNFGLVSYPKRNYGACLESCSDDISIVSYDDRTNMCSLRLRCNQKSSTGGRVVTSRCSCDRDDDDDEDSEEDEEETNPNENYNGNGGPGTGIVPPASPFSLISSLVALAGLAGAVIGIGASAVGNNGPDVFSNESNLTMKAGVVVSLENVIFHNNNCFAEFPMCLNLTSTTRVTTGGQIPQLTLAMDTFSNYVQYGFSKVVGTSDDCPSGLLRGSGILVDNREECRGELVNGDLFVAIDCAGTEYPVTTQILRMPFYSPNSEQCYSLHHVFTSSGGSTEVEKGIFRQ